MESWDHPQKGPYFFNGNIHYTWNLGLEKETALLQDGIGQIKLLREIPKFRYVHESWEHVQIQSKAIAEDIQWINENAGNYMVYPVCLSSSFHDIQKHEVSFIKYLASLCEASHITLYIRPYPLAPAEDLDELKDIQTGAIHIGAMLRILHGAEVFNDEYLKHKCSIIKNAHTILNVGTTFVLDAAHFDSPICQLRLDTSFGKFSEVSNYPHIRQFLNNGIEEAGKKSLNNFLEFIEGNKNNIREELSHFLQLKK